MAATLIVQRMDLCSDKNKTGIVLDKNKKDLG